MANPIRLYEPMPLVTNAVKKLGRSLADGSPLSESDQRTYESFIADARARVAGTQIFVRAAVNQLEKVFTADGEFEIAGRVKTRSTLADKLARTPAEKLPSVHDVAGIRIVHPGGLLTQEIVARTLAQVIDDRVETTRNTLWIDRRQHPSHGYRAVHIIAWPGGRPIEIQVRTELQHAWAQVMELMGDRWGREPRYGLSIAHDNPVERLGRQEAVDALVAFSADIAAHEEAVREADLAHMDLDPIRDAFSHELYEHFRQSKQTVQPLEELRVEWAETIRGVLEQVRRVLES